MKKCSLFSFSSYRSVADLLTIVTDRIAKAFNSCGATLSVALDICKALDSVWHTGPHHKLKSYGIWPYFIFSQ